MVAVGGNEASVGKDQAMAVVTISRQFGAGGDEIALKMSELLGYDLVDNALIVKVAERAGVSFETVEHLDEKYQSRAVGFLKSLIEPRMGKILAGGEQHIDPKQFVEYAKTVIRGLADHGNVIVVGRGSQFILKDVDNAFHIKIIADENIRAERIMARHDISHQEALDRVRKSDKMRTHFIERYLKADWDDPLGYHVAIDSARLGIDTTAEILANAVSHFSDTHEFIPGERDRRKTDRREEDRRSGDRRITEVGWAPRDLAGAASREGRPLRTHSKPDRRKMPRRQGKRRDNI